MTNVQNPRDRSAVCPESGVCGDSGGECGVSSAGSPISYRPDLEFHHHLQRHPSLCGRKHRKDKILLCWALNQLFLSLRQGKCFPASLAPTPTLLFPPSVPQAQVPPTRTGISQAIDCKLPEGWSVGLPWTLKRSTFSPGTLAGLGACALMLCWEPELFSAS